MGDPICRIQNYTQRTHNFIVRNEFPLLLDTDLMRGAAFSRYQSRYISSTPQNTQNSWRNTITTLSRANTNLDRWLTRGEVLTRNRNTPAQNITTSFHAVEVQPKSFTMNELHEVDLENLTSILREYRERWTSFALENPEKMQQMGFDLNRWQSQISLYGLPIEEQAQTAFLNRAKTCSLNHEELAAIYTLLHLPRNDRIRELTGPAPLTPEEVYCFYEFTQFLASGNQNFLDMPVRWDENTQQMVLESAGRSLSVREVCLPGFVATSQVSAIRNYIETHGELRIILDKMRMDLHGNFTNTNLTVAMGLLLYYQYGERRSFNGALQSRCPSENPDNAWRDFQRYRQNQIQSFDRNHYRGSLLREIIHEPITFGAFTLFILPPDLEHIRQKTYINLTLALGIFYLATQGGRVPYDSFIENRCRPEVAVNTQPQPQATRPARQGESLLGGALALFGVSRLIPLLARQTPRLMTGIAEGFASLRLGPVINFASQRANLLGASLGLGLILAGSLAVYLNHQSHSSQMTGEEVY